MNENVIGLQVLGSLAESALKLVRMAQEKHQRVFKTITVQNCLM